MKKLKSNLKYFFVVIITILLCQESLSAQISGIKTIPGDYPGFAEAITVLNTQGVGTGGVIFNVAAGFIDTAINLAVTASGTSSNRITFQKSGSGANPLIFAGAGTSIFYDGIFKLIGSDYVTIDGIDLKENPANPLPTKTAEWGYALLKANETNGCRYNIIKNCSITLNKLTSSATGIYAANHKDLSATELLITDTLGTNSNNKFLNNIISNVLVGISLMGYKDFITPYRFYDQRNEIGAEEGKRNMIFNFGGEGLSDASGIYARYQDEIKIYNSNINSKGSKWHKKNLRGIYLDGGYNNSADIFGDTITVGDSAAVDDTQVGAIICAMGAGGTDNSINIYNNVIKECEFPEAARSNFNLIGIIAGSLHLNIYNNKIINNTYGSNFSNANGIVSYIGITGDNVSVSEISWKIYNNIISNNINSQAGVTQGARQSGINVSTTIGRLVEIYDNLIENNRWFGNIKAINRDGNTGLNCYNNIIRNINIPESNLNNSFIVINSDNSTGISTGTINDIYNNTIANIISGASTKLTGIYLNSSSVTIRNIYKNIITDLSSNGGRVCGIELGHSNTVNFYRNKIAGLHTKNNTATGIKTINDIFNLNVYNNFISELYASSAATDTAVSAMTIGNINNARLYYNTIYLDAVSTSPSKFGTSGIFVKNGVSNLDLRNNIIINVSTPGPESGYTIAFRKEGSSLDSYSNNSGNNIYYAGVPSHNRVIFYDGVNADSTLAQYKARVTPRDMLSFSELSPFINITSSPYDLRLKDTVPTYCADGAVPIITPFQITEDYYGNIRSTTTPDIGANEGNFKPIITNVSGNEIEIPVDFALYQNFPNPFNPATSIKYDIPFPAHVKLNVFDITGRIVAELVNLQMQAGRYEVKWNADNISSGIYFYSIRAGSFNKTYKMLLVK